MTPTNAMGSNESATDTNASCHLILNRMPLFFIV
jgi:hypothetical protein